jgi:hypothetical protein
MSVEEANKQADLYFVNANRIVFLPQGWCEDFKEHCLDDDPPQAYCWIGQESVNNWLTSPSKEWYTTDAQGWMDISDLETMPQVTEAVARKVDPDLFRLLDAVNSGEAN